MCNENTIVHINTQTNTHWIVTATTTTTILIINKEKKHKLASDTIQLHKHKRKKNKGEHIDTRRRILCCQLVCVCTGIHIFYIMTTHQECVLQILHTIIKAAAHITKCERCTKRFFLFFLLFFFSNTPK